MVLLATMMLPGAVTLMPQFLIYRSLGWIDTLKPLWVPSFFGVAFNIFLLRQFFMGIPLELEEAARIDGCSYYTIFWRIMLPQIKPALAAITIMAFMGAWNNFQGPLIYISSPENQTLAYALQLFQSAHRRRNGPADGFFNTCDAARFGSVFLLAAVLHSGDHADGHQGVKSTRYFDSNMMKR